MLAYRDSGTHVIKVTAWPSGCLACSSAAGLHSGRSGICAQATVEMQCPVFNAAWHLLATRLRVMPLQVDEALIQQLDDHLVMLQSMGFSPHKKPFEDRLAKWEMQLRLVSISTGLGAPQDPPLGMGLCVQRPVCSGCQQGESLGLSTLD